MLCPRSALCILSRDKITIIKILWIAVRFSIEHFLLSMVNHSCKTIGKWHTVSWIISAVKIFVPKIFILKHINTPQSFIYAQLLTTHIKNTSAFNFCVLWPARNFSTTKITYFMVHVHQYIHAHHSVCLINRDYYDKNEYIFLFMIYIKNQTVLQSKQVQISCLSLCSWSWR